MDRLGDVGEADFGDVVLDAIGLGFERGDRTQERMDRRGLEPRIAQFRARHVVEMEMRIYEWNSLPWSSPNFSAGTFRARRRWAFALT